MRTVLLALAATLLIGLGSVVVAEDDPPVAPKPPAEEQPPAPAPEEGEEPAPEPEEPALAAPKAAHAAMTKHLRSVAYQERRAEQARRAREYLEAFEAAGMEAGGEDAVALARFYAVVERYGQAMDALRGVIEDEAADVALRDSAMTTFAGYLIRRAHLADVEASAIAEALGEVEAYLGESDGPDRVKIRGQLHWALASYHEEAGNADEGLAHRLHAALDEPHRASSAARYVQRALLKSTHDMDGYAPLRTSARALFSVLEHLARENLETAEGDRATRTAKAGLARLQKANLPFDLLGTSGADWTLEHAFGETERITDLRGKVVVLDFWATWCPWCIRSFPAIRDLLRDYEDEGLAVVGITASSSSVYESRYDLDDDLKERAEEGVRPTPAARLDTGRRYPDDGVPVLEEAAYREREIEAIKTFIGNHEMTWDVVMIDKTEPSSLYALTGWPHAVVIDRAGRIRYFKAGALLRDREEQVAAFRKVLEDLLAE